MFDRVEEYAKNNPGVVVAGAMVTFGLAEALTGNLEKAAWLTAFGCFVAVVQRRNITIIMGGMDDDTPSHHNHGYL